MSGTGALRLGPAARKLISPDKWTDGYPVWESYSRELDALVDWASAKGCLWRFQSRLESKNTQRDEALAELCLAYLLDSVDFPIVRWDPLGANGKKGEYLLATPETTDLFVELKSPGWESELTPAQRAAAGNTSQSMTASASSTHSQECHRAASNTSFGSTRIRTPSLRPTCRSRCWSSSKRPSGAS